MSGVRAIYAGTYSGLDYHTDGKSHQSIADMQWMASMPHMTVVEPLTASHAVRLLNTALRADVIQRSSFFFRLRRTPFVSVEALDANIASGDQAGDPLRRLVGLHSPTQGLEIVIIVAGPLAAAAALGLVRGPLGTQACSQGAAICDSASVIAVPATGPEGINGRGVAGEDALWREALGGATTILSVEDDSGALHDLVQRVVPRCCSSSSGVRFLSKRVSQSGPSLRTLPASLEFHGFRPEDLLDILRQ